MRKIVAILVGLLGLLLASPGWALELTILHVNDSHSYLESTGDKLTPGGEKTYVQLGAWTRLTTAVNHVRRESENVALLHAGDAVQGGLYFMKYDGRPEMEFLNRLKFDGFVLGNHEFDKGPEFLTGFLEHAGIPVLSANIEASGKPRLAARVKPYTILNYGAERIGVIGLTTKDTAFTSSPGPAVQFLDEAKTAQKYVDELQEQGVNKIILLTHVGLARDKELAATVSGVDVIVGGHSHSLLADSDPMRVLGKQVDGEYPVVVKGVDGNDVYVVTAWKWGRVLGRLDVDFDEAGEVVRVKGCPVMLVADDFKRKDSQGQKVELGGVARQAILEDLAKSPVAAVVAEDAPAAEFLEPYTQGVEAMRSDVIGRATASLPHITAPGVNRDGVSLPHGSLIAPHVAKAMLEKIATTGAPADCCLLNAGGVRESVAQGNISIGTAYQLMPFNNTLYLLTLTGAQLKDALEYGVTRSEGAFPYVAGMRYSADMNQPEGSRITTIDIHSKDGEWITVDPAQTYRVVTNAYLARGGDGYVALREAADRYDTGFVDTESFIEYVKRHKKLSPLEQTGVTYIPQQ